MQQFYVQQVEARPLGKDLCTYTAHPANKYNTIIMIGNWTMYYTTY